MGIYEAVGKTVMFLVGLGVIAVLGIAFLAYFGVLTPQSKATMPSFEEINLDVGRYVVYLQENKFDEAKNSLLDAKLKLSDIEVQSASLSLSEQDRTDLNTLIASFKSLLEGLNLVVDTKKLESQTDILTWDSYNNMVGKFIAARNKYADSYNQANKIQNAELKANLNLTAYSTAIENMDKQIKYWQSENMTAFVEANTYISKINPLDNDVRSTAASIEREFGTGFDQRLVGIATYFSGNLKYIHIPNWNPSSNIQYIQDPNTTMAQKGGNCADLSILFSSLAESIGISTEFCFADTTHTYSEIQVHPELFKANHAMIQYFDEKSNGYSLDPTCYAGTSLEEGDRCNQAINYAVKCYDVKKFREALKQSVNS